MNGKVHIGNIEGVLEYLNRVMKTINNESVIGKGNIEVTGGSGTDDQTASEVPFTPYSTISATNVQDAIQELLDESGGSGLTQQDIDTLAELNAIITDATLIDTNDSRLSDARTPTSHNHTASEISDFDTEVSNNIDVAANTAKVGITTQQANDITANNAKISYTDAAKVSGIEDNATADQTDAEIETAYNNQVAQVSTGEKTAGTETAVRRFSPKDVADMAGSHGGGGLSSYMFPIWAEENAALGASNTYEWAFGNGANTPNDGGLTVYVPSTHTCTVVAMSLRVGGGTATVELVKNGTVQGSACNVVLSSGQSATNDSFTPISLVNNDYINFRTTSSSGTSSPCVVTAWLKYTAI